jgi:hypothetical protein
MVGQHACTCGAAGMPCRAAISPGEEELRLLEGFKIEFDKDG